jgi:hypothetical protein
LGPGAVAGGTAGAATAAVDGAAVPSTTAAITSTVSSDLTSLIAAAAVARAHPEHDPIRCAPDPHRRCTIRPLSKRPAALRSAVGRGAASTVE